MDAEAVWGNGGREHWLVVELSHYMTPAGLLDLEATLGWYRDEDAAEIREILAAQVIR